jgi:hypothetical protein
MELNNEYCYIREYLYSLREKLEKVFSLDTSVFNSVGSTPSAGHCAVVSVIVNFLLGGKMCSAIVGNQSHWFNIFNIDEKYLECDLTGDQFGFPPVQISEDHIYSDVKIRHINEVNTETLNRSIILAKRAGLDNIESMILEHLDRPFQRC